MNGTPGKPEVAVISPEFFPPMLIGYSCCGCEYCGLFTVEIGSISTLITSVALKLGSISTVNTSVALKLGSISTVNTSVALKLGQFQRFL